MTGKIFRSCFLVGLAVMILCTGLFVAVMASQYEEEVYQQLQEELAYVKHGMEESGQAYLTGLRTTQRLTWVDTDGTVLYDSVADPATMENHGDRAEIRQALEEGSGQGKHLSNTLLQKNLYYAARLSDGTVLRISCVETTVGALILGVLQPVLWILVLALILSGILASRLSRQITKPINSLDLENPRLDETYEEIFPLVSRLREQNRTIGRQMDALGRRQREFAALAENMSEGVLLIDSRYHVLSGNQSAFHLLGEKQQPESIRQGTCRREIWEAAGKALAGRHAETLMRGESHIFEILASPVTANGQVTGAVILMVDVTEREERESLRREFSANVSHELKTPLTSISGFAELMKEGLVEADKMREFAGDIYKECGQLIALIDDIMKLSRLDEGSEELSAERVDLYDLSQKILQELTPVAAKRGISLHMEGGRQTIQGVWRILHEMIYNLCDNAIKYNKDGGAVTVRVTEEEDQVVVSVEDTGIGISEGQQDRVFERFYRVDKSHSRRVGGTGLGLSIVKHGAQYHNAQLSLDSEPGAGTTITLRFPKQSAA
ncbi:MAG: ATP-binding protein [Evtepia gabavorous]